MIDNSVNAVIAIDPDSGTQTVLSDRSTPNSVAEFRSPIAIAFDAARDRVFVTTNRSGGPFIINPVDGSRSLMTNLFFGDDNPVGIALDSANSRLLISDNGANAIFSVNEGSGTRTILSDASLPTNASAFVMPMGIAVDSPRNRALVVDAGLQAVVEVSLSDGSRRILSGGFVADGQRVRVVDLVTGERVVL